MQEDELIADVTDLLSDLVVEGQLELVTRHGPTALAMDLSMVIEQDPNTDLEAWFLEHDEVVELYLDGDALHQRVKPILHRLVHGDPPPKWNDALAKPILDNPEDANAWLVFADWLQQEGDPRGELISLHAKLGRIQDRDLAVVDDEDGTTKPDPVAQREKSLRRRFRVHFYGAFAHLEADVYQFVWRLGFLATASVSGHDVDKLVAHPSSRFLEKLTVPTQVGHGVVFLSSSKSASAPAAAALPITLTEIEIGRSGKGREDEFEDVQDQPVPRPKRVLSIGGASSLINKLARLERLNVTFKNLAVVDDLDFPKVTELLLYADELSLARMTKWALPSLTYLSIVADSLDDTTALAALFESPPTNLKRLRLSVGRGADPVEILLGTPLMKQLKELDLRAAGYGSNDVAWFDEHAKSFEHLESLDLRRNYLGYGTQDQEVLNRLCKTVLLGREANATDEDDDDEEYDEDEDEYGEDDDYNDPVVNEDEHDGEEAAAADDDDDAAAEEEPDDDEGPGAVDRGAPVEERERYDEPVE